MKSFRFLAATALTSVALFSTSAFAQTESSVEPDPAATLETEVELESGEAVEDDELIVVSGSRILRPNIDSTVPITSVGAPDLLDDGNLSLGDALNQLPSMRSTFSQANSTRFIGTAGLSVLDLRGLGTDRTLVLVNGRRHVSSSPGDFTVDVNTIPTDLLERVDVITGGNSAIYGSDAVAGVVNFVLRRDYEGIKIRGQGGVSDRGDRGSYFLSGVAGQNFWDNRANITVAGEYARSNPLYFADRPRQTGAFSGPPGFYQVEDTLGEPPEGDGIPDRAFFQEGPAFGIISLGGTVLTSCPAAVAPTDPNFAVIEARRAAVCTGEVSPTGGRLSNNFVFLQDGTLVIDPVETDLRSVGGGRFGGLTASGVEGAMLLPGLERWAGNVMANVEISPAFQPFVEAKYVRITANQTSTQPTFVNSSLSPVFSIDNPFLTEQARSTISTITGGSSTFTMFRFNNDIGTRAEDHERDTFRIVGGVRGDLSDTGNWNYEVALNYGRTETYYETGGNVLIDNFNNATDAVRNDSGQIVCGINADDDATNDDAACVPLNLFGQGSPSPEAVNYVLHTSSREQWATQFQAVAFVSGDSSGFFELPGGPIGIAVGAEYRKEDAFSDYDDVTQSGVTFLNSIAAFDPPSVSVKEAFGEIRVPILADTPFFEELSLEGAVRASDYSSQDELVWAYNFGAIWSPVRDIRLRAGYARSVRAPNLSDLFATRSQTFANNVQDPCDQRFIDENPNRARNCAEAGIPTTILLPGETEPRPWTNAPSSGISGFNQGNPNLEPEVGKSFTIGAVLQPRFLPGFSLTIDYYNIEIEQAISGLTGQAIINRCYDDPVSIDNPFCDAVFRRRSDDVIADFTFDGQAGRRFDGYPDFNIGVIGPGFLNQPFNYQSLKTSGIDFDAAYRRNFGDIRMDLRAIVSWLMNREQFTFITDPERSVRLHGVLGDPEWAGSFSAGLDFGQIDVEYDLRFIDRQTIGSWETQFSHQGRPPENADLYPVTHYPRTFYHDLRLGFEPAERFRFYAGIENIFDTLPPYGATGTGEQSAIFPVTGRVFYAGAEVTF